MYESVIYQDILEKGRRRGAISMVLRLLHRRIGALTPELQARIQSLSIAQLEDLGEALLDFSQPTDNPYFWIVHKFLPSPLATHIGWL